MSDMSLTSTKLSNTLTNSYIAALSSSSQCRPTLSSSGSDTGSTVSSCPELLQQPSQPASNPSVYVVHAERFHPRFASRAHLNIFTAKEQTKQLRTLIAEDFENEQVLYYYIDISTALQMNDAQMRVHHLSDGRRVALVHYDLHCKWSRRALYGVVTPNLKAHAGSHNDGSTVGKNKWRWQLEAFLDAEDLAARYGITEQYLPLSSRQMRGFKAQLQEPPRADQLSLAQTDWSGVQQIKSLKRGKKAKKSRLQPGGGGHGAQPLRLSTGEWLSDIRTSLAQALPMVPVVINKNNAHWVEWVQVVRISRLNVFVGISLKRRSHRAQVWTVQSIDLDVGRIFNKHRLVGLARPLYTKALRDKHAQHNRRRAVISELVWTPAMFAPNYDSAYGPSARPMAVDVNMSPALKLTPPMLHNPVPQMPAMPPIPQVPQVSQGPQAPQGTGAVAGTGADMDWVHHIVDDVLADEVAPPRQHFQGQAPMQAPMATMPTYVQATPYVYAAYPMQVAQVAQVAYPYAWPYPQQQSYF